MAESSEPRRTLADKLGHLFDTVHPPGRGPYSYREVETGIREAGGPRITAAWIWQLRTGRSTNPKMQHVQALADFFGVPPAYFFDDEATARIDNQLELIAAMRDAEVRDVALRTMDLDDDARRSVAAIVREISQLKSRESQPGSTGQDRSDDEQ